MSVSCSTDEPSTLSEIVYLLEKTPNWIMIICKLVTVDSALNMKIKEIKKPNASFGNFLKLSKSTSTFI